VVEDDGGIRCNAHFTEITDSGAGQRRADPVSGPPLDA
jgi:hypothetical protein